jgi:hypothetical protein
VHTKHVSQNHDGTTLLILTETTDGVRSSLQDLLEEELEECGNDKHSLAVDHVETGKDHQPQEVCVDDQEEESFHQHVAVP